MSCVCEGVCVYIYINICRCIRILESLMLSFIQEKGMCVEVCEYNPGVLVVTPNR